MGGWLGNHCPIDRTGFLEFARTLARPDIYDVISARRAADRRRHVRVSVEPAAPVRRLTRFPENYLVMGDALCSFNPLYGQGMSVATLEGAGAARCLEQSASLRRSVAAVLQGGGTIIASPWMIAVGADFAFEGVTGAKPAGTDLVNWYIGEVHKAASIDPTLCRRSSTWPTCSRAGVVVPPAAMARVAKACLLPGGAAAPRMRPRRADTEAQRLAETL